MDEMKLRAFENKSMSEYMSLKWMGMGSNEGFIIIFMTHVIQSGRLNVEYWGGQSTGMGEGRIPFKMLTGKPTRKRPLGRPRSGRKDNIPKQ